MIVDVKMPGRARSHGRGRLLAYLTSWVEANIVPGRALATDEDSEVFVANAKRLWKDKKSGTGTIDQ